ncbi:MAG: Ig-like domain-containing protein [Archaeoglobaceae archaeon]
MEFMRNEKGVSPLLGFILMLMILMISISALQTQHVPDVSKNIEAEHMKQITDQLMELKSISSAKNVKFEMGVDYPDYLFLITPQSAATTMNVKDFEVDVEYTEVLANGSKVERESNFTSSRIKVSPNYLFYPKDELILENTAILKYAGRNYISISEQSSFKNEVNFMLLNTTFDSISTTQSLSLFSVPQSTGGRVLAENLSISFESVHPQYWQTLKDYNVTVNGDRVTIKKEEKTVFSLDEVMLYTGNERISLQKPSRMVKTNSLDTFSLNKGESVKLGVRVVDKYNNPVEGIKVNATVNNSIGETSPSVLYTNSEGEVYTTFNAHNVGVGTVTFKSSPVENEVSYNISTTQITGESSLSISLSSDPAAAIDGYSSKTIKAYVSSEGDPLPGYNVVFASNSTGANFNSTEVKTSHSGYASVNLSQDAQGKNWYKVYGYAGSSVDSLDVLLNSSTGESGVDTGPSIETFNVEEVVKPNHYEFSVDWAVSDEDGDLSSVELVLEDLDDGPVTTETEPISGSSASGNTKLKDKNPPEGVNDYEVTLTVSDGEGNSVSETKTVTGGDGV